MAGRVVVVTGANRGIGLSLVKLLHANGYQVVGTARDSAKCAEASQSLQAQGVSVDFLPLEVAQEQSRNAFIKDLTTKYPNINAFVNNAAIGKLEWNAEVFQEVFDTNVHGTFDINLLILPYLQKGSVLVNVSSNLGQLAHLSAKYKQAVTKCTTLEELYNIEFYPNEMRGEFAAAYKVSKAALNRGTQFLALKNPNVYLKVVHPGHCQTDLGGSHAPLTADDGGVSIFKAIHDPAGVPVYSYNGHAMEW